MSKFIAKFRKDKDVDDHVSVMLRHEKNEQKNEYKKLKNKRWHIEDLVEESDDRYDEIDSDYDDHRPY